MNKQRRLEAILALIPPCRCLADIGCDHGILAHKALLAGRAQRVILSDISAQSLAKAETLLAQNPSASFRCGAGLETLSPEEADVICIAGMGALEIRNILEAGKDCAMQARALVLGPHRRADTLREYLRSAGYRIRREEIAEERGHFYPLILACPGADPERDPFWNHIAKGDAKSSTYRAYLKDMLARFRVAAEGMERSRANCTPAAAKELRERCRRIEDMLARPKGLGAPHCPENAGEDEP